VVADFFLNPLFQHYSAFSFPGFLIRDHDARAFHPPAKYTVFPTDGSLVTALI